MSKREKLISKARNNPKGLRFDEACKLAELIGFEKKGGSGSHSVYASEGIMEIINLQPRKDGKAKGVQVEQILALMDRFNLQ